MCDVQQVSGVTGEEQTYEQLHANVIKVASAFARSGLHKGDVVTVLSPNCIEYATIYLGALAAGGIVSTLNPQYTACKYHSVMQYGLHYLQVRFRLFALLDKVYNVLLCVNF